MTRIVVKTQAELDALPASFAEYTIIELRGIERIILARARENSSVVAWENSSVVAWGNSSVEARENSSVVARENSSVVARENSSVVAWGNSSVVARGNSSVVARGNSSVVAWENSVARLFSSAAKVELAGFAVCFHIEPGIVLKKADTATVIKPIKSTGTASWLDGEGVLVAEGSAVLYKKVSVGFLTQEGTRNETSWMVGATVEHANWTPAVEECGAGKFHACSRPYFCDEFRNEKGDQYIAIRVDVSDLYAWPNASYPHKIAFRKGTVLHRVTRFGKPVESQETVSV